MITDSSFHELGRGYHMQKFLFCALPLFKFSILSKTSTRGSINDSNSDEQSTALPPNALC